MSEFFLYDQTTQDIGRGVHNFHTAVWRVAFSNRAPLPATDSVFADIVEIASGFGYPAGGPTISGTSWTQTAGVSRLPGVDIILISNAGPVGPFRYLVLYNSSIVGGRLVGWWDRGAPITLDGTISDPFTLHWSDLTQILSLSKDEPEPGE